MLSSLSAFDAFGILLVLKTNNEKGSGAYAGMSPQAQTYKSHNRRSAAGRSGASCQACRPESEGHPDGRGALAAASEAGGNSGAGSLSPPKS